MPSEPISILKNQSNNSKTRLKTGPGGILADFNGCQGTFSIRPTPTRVKFELPQTSGYVSFNKADIIKTDVNAIMDSNAISLALRSQNIQDEVLIKWLDQLGQHVSLFDKKNEHLVDVLLDLDWSRKSDALIHSYCEVMLNLVTAFTYHTKSVIRMIVQRFMPILPPNVEQMDIADLKFEKLHNLLQSILKLIPSSTMILTALLAEKFPYMKKNWFLQKCYLTNLFEITRYAPSLRKSILELIIAKMIQLDVHCSKADLEETEAADDDEMEKEKPETIFKMETDETPNQEEELTKHPIGKVLDCLLHEMYSYIDSVCWKTSDGTREEVDLNWDSTKKLYRELLTIFDFVILPTHACSHVQFVMFYICSFKNLLAEGFIDYLWKQVQNPNVATIKRQVAVCYLGSFLCRASFVKFTMLKDAVNILSLWLHSYLGNITGSVKNIPDSNYHGTFYAISQIVFYVVAFRHKELVESEDGIAYLQSLNLERLVTCSLNPLKVCLPTVVTNFASVARNYQFAYCYTVIEKNNRMRLPVTNEVASLSAGYSSFSVLETFFPFDPYLLKKSGEKIKPLYRVYSGKLVTEVVDEDDDEDDFIQDTPTGTTPTSPNIVSDVLSYGSSPGFKCSPMR